MTEISLGVGESLFEGPAFEEPASEKALPRRVPALLKSHIHKMIMVYYNSLDNSDLNQR